MKKTAFFRVAPKLGATIGLLVFNFFFFSTPLSAQWEVKHAIEDDKIIQKIEFFDDQFGFAMGTNGLILKSTDSGESWETIDFPDSNFRFRDFEFINADTILAVAQSFPSSTPMGQKAYLLISEDQGNSWNIIYEELNAVWFNIDFKNYPKGASAGWGGIQTTEDGGLTWEAVDFVGEEITGYDIKFVDDQLAYAVINNFFLGDLIIKTTDGGQQWDISYQGSNSGLLATYLEFLDTETLFVLDVIEFEMFKSNNGGDSWTEVELNSGNIADLHFPSIQTGYGVSITPEFALPEFPANYSIIKTTDGGDSWEEQTMLGVPLESIHFLNDSVGFVAGWRQLIMKTYTGGGTEIIGDYPYDDPNAVQYIPSEEVDIFPNPAFQQIQIQTKGNYQFEQIEIFNSQQQSVLRMKFQDQIDISKFPKAIYTMVLTDQQGKQLIKKFIKQ